MIQLMVCTQRLLFTWLQKDYNSYTPGIPTPERSRLLVQGVHQSLSKSLLEINWHLRYGLVSPHQDRNMLHAAYNYKRSN